MKKYSELKILVAGASGYVGGHLVPKLMELNYSIRCLARNPEKIRARNWSNVEIVKGDVLEPETLQSGFQGVDIAYYLIHSMGTKENFESLDIQAARNFGKAAKQAGTKRIIYLGGLAGESKELSPHLKSRQETGKALAESGVPVTELRASIIIGSGSASFEIIRDLTKKLPLMITPKWVKSLCEPIAIKNVLEYLLACVDEPRTIDQVLEIGGGEILSYRKMMKSVAEVMGKKILMIPVPVLTPRLSAYWLNIVTTVPMSIAHPLVEGLRNDSICTDFRIRDWINIELLSFKDAVGKSLERDASGAIESSWTEAGSKPGEIKIRSKPGRLLQDKQIIETTIGAEKVFSSIQKIGGNVGWYYAGWAWRLRGLVDRLIGGVGMRLGRRHPSQIRVGDPIDFWRVEKYIPKSHLKLKAEMKLPGEAWLEFKVDSNSKGNTVLQQIATFKPNGWIGSLYWYILSPAHLCIFKNMARNIVNYSSPDAQ
jgi:uncharacterized protein YbjT (DUF2867 family)